MDQQKDSVHPQSKAQEGNYLRGAGVEGDARQCRDAETGGNADGNEHDAGNTESSVGFDSVGPVIQGYAGIHHLNNLFS